MSNAQQSWTAACRKLEAMGADLLAGADGPGHAEELLEHLIDQTVVWLAWEVLNADPAQPAFHRHNDHVSQWGGPNADNVYKHARVDPRLRYRVTGHMHSCDQFILAMRAGFMHNEVWGTKGQVVASDIGVGKGDDFSFTLGPGCDFELPDGVIMCSIREYYYDWERVEPAVVTIECLDEPLAPPPTLEDRIDQAMLQVDDSVTNWIDYLNENREQRVDNQFESSIAVSKGLSQARYSFCFWDLAPDEVLVVECDVPEAAHWGMQLYKMDTFELVDPVDSSLNQHQMKIDADGRFRLVMGGVDVGAPNWLNSLGRRTGLMTLRWFWPSGESAPEPVATKVAAADAFAALPDATVAVTPEQRSAEVRERRAHINWRFRA